MLPWQPFLAFYGMHNGATWRIRLNRPCAAAMRPYVKLLWPPVSLRFCTICEVQNADNVITYKILSDDKVREVYATTTSSVSAGNAVKLTSMYVCRGIYVRAAAYSLNCHGITVTRSSRSAVSSNNTTLQHYVSIKNSQVYSWNQPVRLSFDWTELSVQAGQ